MSDAGTEFYLFIGEDRHVDNEYKLFATEAQALAYLREWQETYGDYPGPDDWEQYGQNEKSMVYGAAAEDGYACSVERILLEPATVPIV